MLSDGQSQKNDKSLRAKGLNDLLFYKIPEFFGRISNNFPNYLYDGYYLYVYPFLNILVHAAVILAGLYFGIFGGVGSFSESYHFIILLIIVGGMGARFGFFLVSSYAISHFGLSLYIYFSGDCVLDQNCIKYWYQLLPKLVNYYMAFFIAVSAPYLTKVIALNLKPLKFLPRKLYPLQAILLSSGIFAFFTYIVSNTAPLVLRIEYSIVNNNPPRILASNFQENIKSLCLIAALSVSLKIIFQAYVNYRHSKDLEVLEESIVNFEKKQNWFLSLPLIIKIIFFSAWSTLLFLGTANGLNERLYLALGFFVLLLFKHEIIVIYLGRFERLKKKIPPLILYAVAFGLVYLFSALILRFQKAGDRSFVLIITLIFVSSFTFILLTKQHAPEEPPRIKIKSNFIKLFIKSTLVLFLTYYLFPQEVYADNCSGFWDCYGNTRTAVTASSAATLFAIGSFLLDLSPLGWAKGVVEAFTGKDLLTGEELAWWERALGVIPGGKYLDKGADLVKGAASMVKGTSQVAHEVKAVEKLARYEKTTDVLKKEIKEKLVLDPKNKDIKLLKNNGYRQQFEKALKNEGQTLPKGFQVDHRIPQEFSLKYPEVTHEFLKQEKLTSINDTRILQGLSASVNNRLHKSEFTQFIKNNGMMTLERLNNKLNKIDKSFEEFGTEVYRIKDSVKIK